MHYVQIVDPGISNAERPGTYPAFDLGQQLDVFIRNSSGQPFVGKVWTGGPTVWPDFTHPKAVEYWYEVMNSYHQLVPIDGAWIDMNDPSNFNDGSMYGGCVNDPNDSDYVLDHPAYIPAGNVSVFSRGIQENLLLSFLSWPRYS